MEQRTLVPGLILIGLGVFLGIVQVTGVGAEAVVAVIGGAFLVTYALTRNYGFLVPGGIMTGLGLGIIWETQAAANADGVVVIGLGLGFLAIYVIDLLVRGHAALWWPVIPGGILATIGVLVETEQERWLRGTELLWPAALIVIGGIILLAQIRRGPPETPQPPSPPATQG
ncbi:MAG TPA: hypothetical protein VFV59_08210 [Candidatus Limnocylindria bacterium]|jgi:hypothetical protein|nr:hypothetical protein [Candidatus Limnocylindria bacterium]HEU5325853.1 hypothetical protein [Candidatus Limnocylindria bacterium]